MNTDNIDIEIVENELISVELIEVDRIGSFSGIAGILEDKLISGETPSKVSSTVFRTANSYVSGTLRVYYNGIREFDITELTSTTFQIAEVYLDDNVMVDYLKDAS